MLFRSSPGGLALAEARLTEARAALDAALESLRSQRAAPAADPRVVPEWAKPSKEQTAVATRLSIPVAFETKIGMRFVLIPAGSFEMGSQDAELRRDADEKQHRVSISAPFYMQVTEVTNAHLRSWRRDHRVDDYLNGDAQPAINVSHDDALEFARWASRSEGRNLALPTEAQWEYVCRAGTETPFAFGRTISTDNANYDGDYAYADGQKGPYLRRTANVGSYPANAWNVFDMHGNVWEWTADWYAPYSGDRVKDPLGPSSGTGRVVRGGSWYQEPHLARSAQRRARPPTDRDIILGFRLVATVPK